MKKNHFNLGLIIFLALVPVVSYASGQGGVLDDVLTKYENKVSAWETAFHQAGLFIFWILATISVVMTGAQLIFQRDNISSFFAEIIRLILFLGFFLWILTNGASIATAIRDGLMQLAGQASGNGSIITPSGIVDIGFDLFKKIVDASSIWSPIDSAVILLTGIVILLILAVVGINMLLLLVTAYIVIYSGIIILGFGGGRWTSDMAVSYLKQVLNISLQLAAMILIIGIGQSIVEDTVVNMKEFGIKDVATVLVQAALLVGLVTKIPPLVGSLAGGSGNGGIGQFGAGSVIAATSMAAGAAMGVGAALKSLGTEAAGLAKAFSAAKSSLNSNSDSGNESGGGKMDSAIDAVGGGTSGDNSKQDGKPLTTESGGYGNSAGSSARSSENTMSSGASSEGSSASAGSNQAGESSGGMGNTASSSESASTGSNSGSGENENATPKTTNTGGGSPLAAAMGNNFRAAGTVAVSIAKNKWNSTRSRVVDAIDQSAGGRLAKQLKEQKGNEDV